MISRLRLIRWAATAAPRAAFAIALLWCPALRADVKFTIVNITTDPPGPFRPGDKFKVKVTVRNDGDRIAAGQRFDFIFTSADSVVIALPTGTPALFFGYCPGSTDTRVDCQCFAAWESGQTVEMQSEVTVGSQVRGSVMVTFSVKSGTMSESASVTLQIVTTAPAPDLTVLELTLRATRKGDSDGILVGLPAQIELGQRLDKRYSIIAFLKVRNVGEGTAAPGWQVLLYTNEYIFRSSKWLTTCPHFRQGGSPFIETVTRTLGQDETMEFCAAFSDFAGGQTQFIARVVAADDRDHSNDEKISVVFATEDRRDIVFPARKSPLQIRGR